MRVSINSPIARLMVDLPESKVIELMRLALDNASGTPAPVIKTPTTVAKPTPTPPPKAEPAGKVATKEEPKEYKGFLFIECESCGNFKKFMPKTPISKYHCDCGHYTSLKGMKELFVDCKCGAHFKYMTNAKENTLVIECLSCGSPVDLEYHEKNGNYQTIK